MAAYDNGKDGKKIPSNRLSRVGMFGSVVTKVATNMATEGAKQLLSGKRPSAKDLLLTPKNIGSITDQLAQLRGAAMKVGQLLSMDAGDALPKELTDILAKLRSDAAPMPAKQLASVLETEWGKTWQKHFISFKFKPIAAASIGQVHFAYGDDASELAIKVQYPGIKKSISSDVDNVVTLLRLTGLVPKEVDYKSLLDEAKKQLHDEANYELEAEMADAFYQLLNDDNRFIVPRVFKSLTTSSILTMSFEQGDPIENLQDLPQVARNHLVRNLFELLFKEAFQFKLVQTDPNFANYLYQQESGKIVLLDFGATRRYSDHISEGYQKLLTSALNNDKDGVSESMAQIGFFSDHIFPEQKAAVVNMVMTACEPIQYDGDYDFGNTDLGSRIHAAGMALSMEQGYWHTPPADALFLHRKIGGLFLLAARLNAKVNLREAFEPFKWKATSTCKRAG
ncbi:AarF/ABC1/UbiB kinase family protein [Enterovibrio sp. ZSDZ42]|uniref:AarF/ABC1/UbiB kinase family protein n=1 Tax=Enterovibrio gelatinilyticus TaxID=2899819 RepID=A0ABT5QZ79_9GAMM|nr:AarF/ABC1/UbiB kinase family protein [Enterovibrio sp. ZSDZ42]MDD1793309.1 AarF/ABC1/UbiB kinase family protein [Enterovibrio sp. ZSDZ42]